MPETADPRPQLYAALDQASRVVARVTPERFGQSTPCTEWNVRALGEHMVGVARRVWSIGRGERQEGPVDTTNIGPDGLSKAFDEARHEACAAWEDGTVLGQHVVLPWATLPGALVARAYTLELTTHAWDLAAATGQLDDLDPALADVSLAVASQMLPPEPRGGELPFGPVVEVGGDASPYERLVAYLGRDPRWASHR